MKLKTFISLLILPLTLCLQAQTFCLDLEELSVNESTVTFRIMISGTEDFGLGSSNFQFAFNPLALANPTLVSTPLSEFPPYLYSSLTVTNPLEGEASFNIELAAASTLSFLVNATQQEIAQISFDILDETLLMGIEWSYLGGTTETVVYHENEIDQLFATDVSCLDVSQAVLPIQLTNFQVSKKEKDALLAWSTVTEINFSHFEVERTVDFANWETIAEVDGHGNSVQRRDYSFRDIDPMPFGQTELVFYYRLKSVDLDGSFAYSDLRSIQFNETRDLEIYLFPNPARDYVSVQLSTTVLGENVLVKMMDNSGRVYLTKEIKSIEQKSILTLNTEKLISGVYWVQLFSNKSLVASRKLLKVD